MLQTVLEEEERRKGKEESRHKLEDEQNQHEGAQGDESKVVAHGSLTAPTTWPSYSVLRPEVIQVDSQRDTPEHPNAMSSEGEAGGRSSLLMDDAPASASADHITAEENNRELAFAVPAGDVPEAVCGLSLAAAMTDGELPAPDNTLLAPTLSGAVDESAGVEVCEGEGEASAAARSSEGSEQGSGSNQVGPLQADLRHWLVHP